MEPGNYVRTDDGLIGKIFEKYRGIQNATIYKVDVPNEQIDYTNVFELKVVKSSPNIIDLIEVGDYVNGKKVIDKQYHYTDEDNYDMGEWCIFYENVSLGEYQYDIKSIVTHEQFESMEYKVRK